MDINSESEESSEDEQLEPAAASAAASSAPLLSIKFGTTPTCEGADDFDADVTRGSVRQGTRANAGYFAFRADTPGAKPLQTVPRKKRHFLALGGEAALPPQYTLSAWVSFPLEEHPWAPKAPNKGGWKGSRMTRHRFTYHVVAYGASATSDQYHLAFRQLEGEERLVGINDGDPASDWFVPFTSPAPSRAVMALNPTPGWHLLTLVSDVARKRSTLFLNGEKWGVAAGAADAPLTSFGCNAFAPSERKTCPSAGEFQVRVRVSPNPNPNPNPNQTSSKSPSAP